MYVGASLWVNSEMDTSLFHTCQYSCPWVRVEPYLDVCRSLPLGEL